MGRRGMSAALRSLPSVEQLLQAPRAGGLASEYGRPLTLEAIRAVLADLRSELTAETSARSTEAAETTDFPGLDPNAILERAHHRLADWTRPTLAPAINASGVILHTNLGRAPLSTAALQAVQTIAQGYSTLEYDMEGGRRGSRAVHAEALLTHLTGAEAALVVNNNAGAVLLALTALARRRRVIISRSQLIEIGGGFRIPEVMSQSGARLVEVGTTNRVHLADYEHALEEPAALIQHAHTSNYRIVGFTSQPGLDELAGLAHRFGVLLVDDLGSGALLDTSRFGLAHEPTVQESLAAGADLVCFSGDKLLGGPQAGIIAGKGTLVQKLKRHPLARAMRADKLCLAGLSATLIHYLKDEAVREIPVWQMIALSPEQIRRRAQQWSDALGVGRVIPGQSTVGGGSLPGETLPTFLLALDVPRANRFLERLRSSTPPVIARIQDEQVVLDPRTVLPSEEPFIRIALERALR